MFKKDLSISLIALIIISLLGMCMEVDISIPSFPSIMKHFDVSEAQVQHTLSLNFLALCISGLLYGPLSEAWGRRGLMLFGATCFLVGALGCVFSFSIYQLMFWRFIQGLGASSALVLGFAMVSDKYQGELAAKYIGQINAYCTIFMAGAPIIGCVLIYFFNWRANFTSIAIIALVSWVLLLLGLKETKQEKTKPDLGKIIKDYGIIITHGKFMLYSCMPNLLVTAYLTFVGNASFYYMNSCGLPAYIFAIHQGLLVTCFSATSFFSGKVIKRLGAEQSVLFGVYLCASAAILLAVFAFAFPYKPSLITLAMCLFAVGCAFPMSVTFAQSMEVIPSLKGTCSSFIMSSRLLLSSGALAISAVFFDGSMRPVAIVMGISVLLSLAMYIWINNLKQSGDDDMVELVPEA